MTIPVFVALDGMKREQAIELAKSLKGIVAGFKVNDLLLSCGVEIITALKEYGMVFADPKLHDIPNTVSNGIKTLAGAGADIISVHASGGRMMLEAAALAANKLQVKVIAVTVLTSLSEDDTEQVYKKSQRDLVLNFARMAANYGIHGVVCSPLELVMLGADSTCASLLKITPGIRPTWYEVSDDQVRTDTPAYAIKQGATYLVIGRPITGHSNPVEAVKAIARELL